MVQAGDGGADGAARPAVREHWGVCQQDGKDVDLFTLRCPTSSAEASICTYGATLVSMRVPDAAGVMGDVVHGFESLAAYEEQASSHGCTVGRVCNRIGGAQFTLEGQVYKLPVNNGPNCLHGGKVGFSKYTWEVLNSTESSVKLGHFSPNGDQGFPGNMTASVEFALLPNVEGDAVLSLTYRAETDQTTVVNLTNHAYFNLAGVLSDRPLDSEMLDHVVTIKADKYVPTDADCVPLDEFRPVGGTPFDLTTPCRIGDRIEDDDDQLGIGAGFDHNWVLKPAGLPGHMGPGGTRGLGVACAPGGGGWYRTRAPDAAVEHHASGRVMMCFTEEPVVHLYTGNYLGSDPRAKGGRQIARRSGLCLETQHFTDSPNRPSRPSVVLCPDQLWQTSTVFWFPRPAPSSPASSCGPASTPRARLE